MAVICLTRVGSFVINHLEHHGMDIKREQVCKNGRSNGLNTQRLRLRRRPKGGMRTCWHINSGYPGWRVTVRTEGRLNRFKFDIIQGPKGTACGSISIAKTSS